MADSNWALGVFNRMQSHSEGKKVCGVIDYISSYTNWGVFPKYTVIQKVYTVPVEYHSIQSIIQIA